MIITTWTKAVVGVVRQIREEVMVQEREGR